MFLADDAENPSHSRISAAPGNARSATQEELQRLARRPTAQASRSALERKLRQALKERERIKDAIRRGLIGEITREMLEEVDSRLRHLEAQLDTPARAEAFVITDLPQRIQAKLRELHHVLGRDVDRSRGLLQDLLGSVMLKLQLRGSSLKSEETLRGLLDSRRPSLLKILVAGGFEPPTFGL